MVRFLLIIHFRSLAFYLRKTRLELRRLMTFEFRDDRPIFFGNERLDLTFTPDDPSERHSLHAAGGDPAADFVPQQRTNLISDQPIENAACLLRVDDVLIDSTWSFDRGTNCFRRDLIKEDPKDF